MFCDLDRIRRGPLAQIVRNNPQVQSPRIGQVAADAADAHRIPFVGMQRHRVDLVVRIVEHFHTRKRGEQGPHLVEGEVAAEGQVHAFAVSAYDGHAHGRADHRHIRVSQDLLRLVPHLHFLLRVAVRTKHIAMWNHVPVNGMRVHPGPFEALALRLELGNGGCTGARNALVGADGATDHPEGVVQRLEHHHELGGRAVGICDDAVVCADCCAVHFRHDQRHVRMHAPSAAVVDDGRPRRREPRGPFEAHRSARTEQRHVRSGLHRVRKANDAGGLSIETHFLTDTALAGDRNQFAQGEIPLSQHLQHLAPDEARGADHRHPKSIFHFAKVRVCFVDVCTDLKRPKDLCGLTNVANGMRRFLTCVLGVSAGVFPWRAATAQTQTAWTGDLTSWSWDGTGWTLDLDGAGTAWLATCPGPTALRRWEWHADFAPSTANFSRVFLFDVDSTAGQFLHLGSAGSSDPIVLHAFTSGSPPVPIGDAFPGFFAAGLASSWTASAEGLACAPLGLVPPAFPAAAFPWTAQSVPACIGILATVTASNASGVRFVLLPDTATAAVAPPRLLSAGLAAPDTLLLRFNAPVTPGGLLGAEGPLPVAEEVPHPSGWPGATGAFRVPLPTAVAAGGSADFAASGWEGAAATLVPDTGFTVWRALDGLPAGSLAFTEIMADPTPATRWAELEWVEVYNPGPHALDVAQATWWDAGTGTAELEPLFDWDGLLPPGERAVLSGGAEPVDPTGQLRLRQMRWTGGGTLLDAGDGIGLLGTEGWAAVVHYERSWWGGAGGGTSVSAACPVCCGAAPNWGPQEASPGGPAPYELAPVDLAPAVLDAVPRSPVELHVRCDRALDPAALLRVLPSPTGWAHCGGDSVVVRLRSPLAPGRLRLRIEGARACWAPPQRNDVLPVELEVKRFPRVGDVAVTEIHAAPAGRSEAIPEFVELANLTADTLEVGGIRVNGLPLGLRWLLPFERRALPAGPLANAGGTVELALHDGTVVERVDYSACWHRDRRSEDSGRSLFRLDPTGPALDPRNWDSTPAEVGATPGEADMAERPWVDAQGPHILCSGTSPSGDALLVFTEPLASVPAGWAPWIRTDGKSPLPGCVWRADRSGWVEDHSGNRIWAEPDALPAGPSPAHNWTLNEVLAEPGSADEPFVELRHSAQTPLGLAGLFIANSALPDPADWTPFTAEWDAASLYIPPGEWAFARCPNRLQTANALPLDLPGLSGERSILIGTADALLEAVPIGPEHHVPWLPSHTGVSLERTDASRDAGWVSSATGATPGERNSQWGRTEGTADGALSCDPSTIRLYPAPPPNLATVRWEAPAEGVWHTVCHAFAPTGEAVAELPGPETVAAHAVGTWTWDGRRNACCPVRPGPYWIRVHACDTAGTCREAWTGLQVAP